MRVKFRAECVKDVLLVTHVLTATERATIEVEMLVSAYDPQAPELTIDLTTTTIDELRNVMRAVEDGHMMVETLKPEAEYDGLMDMLIVRDMGIPPTLVSPATSLKDLQAKYPFPAEDIKQIHDTLERQTPGNGIPGARKVLNRAMKRNTDPMDELTVELL
ncbi:MAG TPA: hypothetical protein PLB89_04885 [Flavobacteriales bacterium]|nr:hypothetical protein [Flavobacteriales bacterium]